MKFRKAYIYKNNAWKKVEFEQIKEGQIFKLEEPTGNAVKDKEGYSVFKAIGNPYPMDDIEGNFGIDSEPYEFTQ
jgi:hypothetical protein